MLHGNVFDLVLHEGELLSFIDFIERVLLEKKDILCHYNPSQGVKFLKKKSRVENVADFVANDDTHKILGALEKLLRTHDRAGVIVDYVEMLAPEGTTSFLADADRRNTVTFHRWSLDRGFENSDSVVLLVTENLPELSSKIVSNPRIDVVNIPLPDASERMTVVKLLETDSSSEEMERIAALSAGLKNVQIRAILAPGEDSEEDYADRYELIRESLQENQSESRDSDRSELKTRAKKLTRMTSGMNREQIRSYLRSEGLNVSQDGDKDTRYNEVIGMLDKRKREILEKECFGLVEFVDPDHDFSQVGGMDEVKSELTQIATNIRAGNRSRVPMGLLFTGPMGTGKTFVAEAFAKSSGLTAIKLKNFRSKWVGATEGNLEKILSVVKAIGNVLVIIDEGDRAFGNSSANESDGGTSSRVIARLKEFMSEPSNRGRVLFVLMTNRPDKLDIDIKRAGRLDRKIPFFYAQEAKDIEPVLEAQLRRHEVAHAIEFPRDRARVSEPLVGYSNADIEAMVLSAHDKAAVTESVLSVETFELALADYLPSRDTVMLEYMELLAVFESSSRKLLPKRYAHLDAESLDARKRELKLKLG